MYSTSCRASTLLQRISVSRPGYVLCTMDVEANKSPWMFDSLG
jgi:hypothetical protein